MSDLERRNDFRARIAELEAANAKLEARNSYLDEECEHWVEVEQGMKARIAELEANLRQSGQDLASVVNDKTRLEAERDRLKAWLTKIASQHTLKEHEQLDTGDGDVEYAYDAIIGDARAALSGKGMTPSQSRAI